MERFGLAPAEFLTRKIGLPISGTVNGQVKMEIYPQDPLRNQGDISLNVLDLKIGEAVFGGGAVQLPLIQMAQEGGVPSKIDVLVDKGNVEVKSINFTGGDLELQVDGKIYGARQMENYRFNLKGNFKPSQQLAEKIPLLVTVEKQKAPDGTYPLTITGRLSGPSIRVGEFKLPI